MATIPLQISGQLQLGSTGQDVLTLQNFLVSQGFLSQSDMNTGPGIFGPKTEAAVKAYQTSNGIVSSGTAATTGYGRVGPITLSSINSKMSVLNTPTQNNQQPSPPATTGQATTALPASPTQTNQNTQQNNSGVNTNQAANVSNELSGGTAYMLGDYALVRLSGSSPQGTLSGGTVWLLDKASQTLRPFVDASTLNNFFDGDIDINDVQVLSAGELNAGGLLNGYQILSNEYAIQPDGTAKSIDFSTAQLAARYGQSVNEELEQSMYSALKGMLGLFNGNGISASTINEVKGDNSKMAFYLSAMTYGGYSMSDIYADLKKKELGITNLSPISATMNKTEYVKTSDYVKASNDTRLQPPPSLGSLSSSDLDLAVYNLPDEAFSTLVPILDYDSDEMKKAMEEIETSYYDLLEQQLNANTEQEKALADYNYQTWRDQIEKTYGLQLSSNAIEAWNQIESAYSALSERGIMNSGIQNEGIDDYLRNVRRQDQAIRDEQMSKEETERMNYYTSVASSDEIKALVEKDPDTARKWGLLPSDDVHNALSIATLKAKYPDAKIEDLELYRSILLDENGNYRSTLYQNKMGSLGDLANPTTGTTTGIDTLRDDFQYSEALRKSLLEEEKAYKQYTTPDVAFLRDTSLSNQGINDYISSSGSLTNLADKIKNASLKGVAPAPVKTTPTTTQQSSYSGVQSPLSGIKDTISTIQNKLNTANTSTTTPKTTSYTPTAQTTISDKLLSYGSSSPSSGSGTGNSVLSPLKVSGTSQSTQPIYKSGSQGTTGLVSSVKNTTSNVWNKLKGLFGTSTTGTW